MSQGKIEKGIRVLVKRVNRVENAVADIGDDLDRILQVMDETEAAYETDRLPSAPGSRLEISDEIRKALRSQAEAGVGKVHYETLPDGRTRVAIDGGPPMKLSPVLTSLLRALSADSGYSTDRFVGFKTPDELARMLGKALKKEVKRHAVSEAVRRLRRALITSGYSPYLVESNRRLGYRFGVRRGDDDVTLAINV
jgi:hypothetical protein